jgi:hypothetical protein
MKLSPKIKKFAFRFLVINVVYILVKITIVEHEDHPLFDNTSLFYYITTFLLFIISWETNDWLIEKQVKSKTGNSLNFRSSLIILLKSLAVLIPTATLVYYLGIFEFENLCQIDPEDPLLHFRIDVFRAILIGIAVMIFNLFYHSSKQKTEIEHKMEELKKEIMTSKYKSLKTQISPHFLFNSLNTLTSLMYEDRDLASDFVTRLASSYRYILDNREEDLVSLEKELSFLDSFIFMMNVRHKDSLKISTHILINPEDFLIPTLSIQMLFENALKHNYYSKEKPLEINILSTEGNKIVIQNTLRERKLKEESTKLGINNIKKRYAFYTNSPVVIDKSVTYFRVTLPLLPKKIKEITIRSVS